jgi:Na+/proline symporter
MIDWTATLVFALFFLLVTVLGFVAARWKAGDLNLLHEWGLGGRRFGTVITWFLIGGDFYTAYTVIAVPALVFSVGAYGFFALPYTIIVYPIVFVTMPRLWQICRENDYLTAADFVHGRFGSKSLALAVAVTGIFATMPYIALQLIGMQVVIAGLGFGSVPLSGLSHFASQLPWLYAIDLQLLGGVWILQIFPAIVFGLYRTPLQAPGLLAGWCSGMIVGTWMAEAMQLKPVFPFQLGGQTYTIYIGLIALSVNLVVSFAGSVVFGVRRR